MNKNLYKILNIDLNKKEVISFVGGGGKTTAMFSLAEELKALGKKVLVTTTTNIFVPNENSFDELFLKDIKYAEIKSGTITIFGQEIVDKKIKGPSLEDLDKIIEEDLFDYYLIEADGAKHKPIKASASHEPIISKLTTKTIAMIGLDALHKNIVETSHRSEILIKLLDKSESDTIEIEDIINLVLHKNGLFKSSKGKNILILNKARDEKLVQEGLLIKKHLNRYGFKNVIVADILTGYFY